MGGGGEDLGAGGLEQRVGAPNGALGNWATSSKAAAGFQVCETLFRRDQSPGRCCWLPCHTRGPSPESLDPVGFLPPQCVHTVLQVTM